MNISRQDAGALIQPIIYYKDMCIFDEGDHYTLRSQRKGILKKWNKKDNKDFIPLWDALRDEGWLMYDINDELEK